MSVLERFKVTLSGLPDHRACPPAVPGAESSLCRWSNFGSRQQSYLTGAVCICLLLAAWLCLAEAQAAPFGFAEAVESYNAGKYSQALSRFQAIRDPDALTHYYMAVCGRKLNQVELAKQHYQWVVDHTLDPTLKRNAEIGLDQLSDHQSASGHQGAPATTGPASSHSSAGRPRVIHFFARWSAPCKRLAPVLADAQAQFHESVDFQRVDIDDPHSAKLVHQYGIYGIMGVPALFYLDRRGRAVNHTTGMVSREELVHNIQALLDR